MKRRSWLVLLAMMLGAIAATFAATASSKPAARSAGTIEVLSLWGGSEKDAFIKVTDAFTQANEEVNALMVRAVAEKFWLKDQNVLVPEGAAH